MKLSSHLLRPDHANGPVSVRCGDVWAASEIENRGKSIQREWRFFGMPIKLSNETMGRQALTVTPDGLSWDEVFELIESAPRKYADANVSDFVGSNGELPSISQITRNLLDEAARRRVIVATQRVPVIEDGKPKRKLGKDGKPKVTKSGQPVYVLRDDVFRFGFSKHASDAAKLPQWFTDREPAASLPTDLESAELAEEE